MGIFFRLGLATLVFALSAMPILTRAQASNQTVLIGVIGPMSTPRGQSMRDAAQFAIDHINQQGLQIHGKSIALKLLVIDDKNDSNLAAIGAHAAVASGVVGVIGHLTSEASMVGAKIYSDAGIAMLSPTAASRKLTQMGYLNLFQMLGHTGYTGQYLAEVAIKILHAKRILLVDNASLYSQELGTQFTSVVRKDGECIVETDTINFNTSDFNSTITKIRNGHPDLIFFTGVTPQSGAFAKRLQQVGVSTPLLLASGSINPQFPDHTEDYRDNTLLLIASNPMDKVPDHKRLEKMYRQKFTSPLLPQSWLAYDAVTMLVDAMKLNNSLDPNLLSPTLHRMTFKGLAGTISFNADGSLANPPYTLYRAVEGHWEMITTFP